MWIRLKNIQLYGYHGAYAHEREHGARFEIDVELEADLSIAAKNDDLRTTIDYVKIQQAVIAVSTMRQFHLLETFADSIASEMLAQFPASEVIVRVRKPGVAMGGVLDFVEIECRKSR